MNLNLESDAKFEATFNQAAVGMAHIALDGTWLLVNQRICDIVGYTAIELRHLTFQDITYPADLGGDLKLVHQLLRNEISSYSIEKRYIKKNGKLTWINLTVSLVRDSEMTPQYFISVIEDINARKRAETELQVLKQSLERTVSNRTEELRIANENLRATIAQKEKFQRELTSFFELSHDIILVANLDGTIRQINKSIETILGYKREELLGRSLIDYVHPEDKHLAINQRGRITNDDVTSNFELRYFDKNHHIVWLSWSYARIQHLKSIFGVARDITFQKKQEHTLAEQKEQIAHASKLNSLFQMASGIAHEINNPMTIINSQVFLLKRKIRNRDINPTYFAEALDRIESVSERIKHIINGLRSHSRDGSNDILEDVVIRDLIEEAMPFVNSKILQHRISLDLDHLPGFLFVKCRRVQVSQVLVNLFENACHAVKDIPDPRWIKVDSHSNKNFAYIEISDNGAGLSDIAKENLFQPFYTTKTVGEGTGLGLSISKSLMLSMDGDLFYDDTKKNTTFVIKMPLSKK